MFNDPTQVFKDYEILLVATILGALGFDMIGLFDIATGLSAAYSLGMIAYLEDLEIKPSPAVSTDTFKRAA